MTIVNKKSLLVLGLVSTLAVGGCATTEGQGTVAGGVLGLGLGLLVCNGDSDCITALTIAGGAGGYVAGSYVAEQKEQYANEEEFYNAELERARQYNSTLQAYHEETSTQLAELEAEADRLEAAQAQGADTREAMAANLELAQAQEEQLTYNISELTIEIAQSEEVLADMRSTKQTERDVAALQAEVDSLESLSASLQQSQSRVASVRSRFAVAGS